MEKLLSTYLYEYRNCPLPGIGSLYLNPGHAELLPGQKRMLAPIPFIELSEKIIPAEDLVNFLAAQTNSRASEAEEKLNVFCNRVKNLQALEEQPLASAGSFYKDSNEVLYFKTIPLPAAFFPEVNAERVIHPDVAHNILVGDTETNSTVMNELLNTTGERPVNRWWIAAVILALIGIACLVIYFTQTKSNGFFGNLKPVEAAQSPKTYRETDK